MNRRIHLLLLTLLLSALQPVASGWSQDEKSRIIEIGTLKDKMRYDREWIGVTPGEKITIVLNNTDVMVHNLVVCRPGKDIAMRVAQAAWNLGASAIEKNYVPEHPGVLAASPLVEPGKSGSFNFIAPEKAGDYPFVCTWPGHAILMRGVLHVGALGDAPPVETSKSEEIPPSAIERARQKMKRYRRFMDGGPTIAGVISPGKASGNAKDIETTNRGIAVRVGEQGEGAILFDTELMRVTAQWTGGFIHFLDGREDERAEYRHEIGGTIQHVLGKGTGWASLEGKWEDPRESKLGPLPKSRAKYLGQYRAGHRVIFRYRINGSDVLDSPGMYRQDGLDVFTRDIRVAASREVRRLRLAATKETHAAVSNHPGIKLLVADGYHEIVISPSDRSILFQAAISSAPCKAGPPDALDALIKNGNAGQAATPIITTGVLGNNDSPYTVDTLTLPYENPWNALFYLGGHDFFSNGDAAVCTSHGDVWIVSGIDENLTKLTWRRLATGLANPLGLRIVDDVIYVVSLHEITRLHDFDRDGAADYYESFNADCEVSSTHHRFTNDLHTDSSGNFYYLKCTDEGRSAHAGSMIRVSPDGEQFEQFATGLRNPNGMSIGPGDVITFGKQQGGWIPSSGIHVVERGKFYGYMPSHHRANPPKEFEKPLCWIPHGIDNSCGGQAWAPGGDDRRFGPLAGQLLHLSYGRCHLFQVLHEMVNGVFQGGVIRIPGIEFESGAMRARFRSQDGQLYVSGLRGWQTSAAMPGCFQRVRYTGSSPFLLPSQLGVEQRGIRISFHEALDKKTGSDPARFQVSRWQYRWTKNYGSPDYRISDPNEKGRDEVKVAAVEVSDDGKSVLLKIQDLEPVMQMAISYDLRSASGLPVKGDLFHTINVVPGK